MIGLKRGIVKLVKHNPQWKSSFAREAKKIRRIFGKDVLNIQHVGSTAIPGILAKPIIDIALTVPSLQKVSRYVNKLRKIGYEKKKNDTRRDRLFFTKGPERKRTHYLHVGTVGSRYIDNMILFRDYLRNHEDTAREYSNLKKKLAARYPDAREVYTNKKEKFIKSVIKLTPRRIN